MKNIFKKNKYINSNPYAFIVFVFLLIMLVLVLNFKLYNYETEGRILLIRSFVKNDLRDRINDYYKINGYYPDSINELILFFKMDYNFNIMYLDILSSEKQTIVAEYRELNDSGGYFYDPNTGEVKLNLSRPVKEYLPFYYVGRLRNSIPSNW